MASKKAEVEQPRSGEVQIGMMRMSEFLLLTTWKSKRMGHAVHDPASAQALRPVFVSQAEYDTHHG